MILKRLSVLGSLLLAACVPSQGPGGSTPAGYYNKVPTKAETSAWAAARRANTANAYRAFIRSYPRSRYVPEATKRLSAIVKKKPPTIRNVSGGLLGNSGGGRSY